MLLNKPEKFSASPKLSERIKSDVICNLNANHFDMKWRFCNRNRYAEANVDANCWLLPLGNCRFSNTHKSTELSLNQATIFSRQITYIGIQIERTLEN